MVKIAELLTNPPSFDLPIQDSKYMAAIVAGASASKELPVFTAHQSIKINNVRITPQSAVTPGGTPASTSATMFFNIWRNAVPAACGVDGSMTSFPFTCASFPYVAQGPVDAPSMSGYAWTGYLAAAVTLNSSTSGTLVATGTSTLATILESTAILAGGTLYLTIEPGTANAETIPVTAYVTGTGVATLAATYNGATGTFVKSHAIGAQVVLGTAGSLPQPANLWTGTTTVATANVTTGGTLTANLPNSLVTHIAAALAVPGATLLFEPGTSNAETVPVTSYNSGTGAYTVAPTYNGGKFFKGHAASSTVVLPLPQAPRQMLKGDVLTLKWVQSATTGLAMPELCVEVNYGLLSSKKY